MDWKRFSAAISAEWKCPVCFSLASKGQWTGQFQLYYGCSRRLCANIHLFITCSLLIFRSTFCLKRSPRRPLREHMNVCFLCKHKKSLTLNWFCRTVFFFLVLVHLSDISLSDHFYTVILDLLQAGSIFRIDCCLVDSHCGEIASHLHWARGFCQWWLFSQCLLWRLLRCLEFIWFFFNLAKIFICVFCVPEMFMQDINSWIFILFYFFQQPFLVFHKTLWLKCLENVLIYREGN